MKNATLVFFFMICTTAVFAQVNTDSLKKILLSASSENRINALLILTGEAGKTNFNDAIRYAEQGISLAGGAGNKKAQAAFMHALGSSLYFKGNYAGAAANYYSSIRLYEQLHDKKQLAFVLNDLAKLFRKTRDLDKALEQYERSLGLFRELKDSFGISMVLNESGVVYEYMANYHEALNRYKGSLRITVARNDSVGIGYAYSNIGALQVLMKQYREAEKNLIAALNIRKDLHDTFSLALSYSDMAALYTSSGNYDKATGMYIQSNAIAAAISYAELMSANYRELSLLEKRKGNYVRAFDYFQFHTALKDSIFNKEKSRQISELATQYETEKKDLEIANQAAEITRKQFQLLVAIISIGVVILLAFLLYNRYRLRQQAVMDAALLRLQEIRNRAIIEAEEKERIRIARDLHDGIGQQLSAVKMNLGAFSASYQKDDDVTREDKLQNLLALLDESVKEVRSVSHNMMPNALLRSGLASAVRDFVNKIASAGSLKVDLHIVGLNGRLENTTETVLYRVVQECVSNIIRHAHATQVGIQLIRHDTHLSLTLEDNGVGFDSSNVNAFHGIGIKNIISRVQFLHGTIDFDSTPGKGTTVIIDIPLN